MVQMATTQDNSKGNPPPCTFISALTNFLGNLKSEPLSCLNMFGIRLIQNIAQPRNISQKFPKVDISCHMGCHTFSKVAKSYKSYKRLPKVLKDCQKLPKIAISFRKYSKLATNCKRFSVVLVFESVGGEEIPSAPEEAQNNLTEEYITENTETIQQAVFLVSIKF